MKAIVDLTETYLFEKPVNHRLLLEKEGFKIDNMYLST